VPARRVQDVQDVLVCLCPHCKTQLRGYYRVVQLFFVSRSHEEMGRRQRASA
jgi:hypothetical protein